MFKPPSPRGSSVLESDVGFAANKKPYTTRSPVGASSHFVVLGPFSNQTGARAFQVTADPTSLGIVFRGFLLILLTVSYTPKPYSNY